MLHPLISLFRSSNCNAISLPDITPLQSRNPQQADRQCIKFSPESEVKSFPLRFGAGGLRYRRMRGLRRQGWLVSNARIKSVIVVHVPEGESGHLEGAERSIPRRRRRRWGCASLPMDHRRRRARSRAPQLLVQQLHVLDHACLELGRRHPGNRSCARQRSKASINRSSQSKSIEIRSA